jgi:hypothetical protein
VDALADMAAAGIKADGEAAGGLTSEKLVSATPAGGTMLRAKTQTLTNKPTTQPLPDSLTDN